MTLVIQSGYSFDSDASTYIDAVETADGQALETGVRVAINDFVLGCKQDEIWDAIKASCILAGARTLDGALVPLVGTAPTNYNFVAGDYDRETGLVGDGSTKYLDSNRATDADPLNSTHNAVYLTAIGTTQSGYIGSASEVGAYNLLYLQGPSLFTRNRSVVGRGGIGGGGPVVSAGSLAGVSRPSASEVVLRGGNKSISYSLSSISTNSSSLLVFRRGTGSFSSARIAFYSIGEALDLALLDTRVSNLMTAIGGAI